VTDVFVLKVIGGPGEGSFECRFEAGGVFRMDAFDPLVGTADAGIRRQAEHFAPAAREVELLRPKVPFPESVVRPFGRKRQPLFAALERLLRARLFGHVMPQQRDSARHRQDSDLQHAQSRSGSHTDLRERSGGPRSQDLRNRLRKLRLPERGHSRGYRAVQRTIAGTPRMRRSGRSNVTTAHRAVCPDPASDDFVAARFTLLIRCAQNTR
jgi:hypothetical protein